MSSHYYVPIKPPVVTDVQPMYWVSGNWLVPSIHPAQLPITMDPCSVPLVHAGHAFHPQRSERLPAPYWARHDMEPGQYREAVIATPRNDTRVQQRIDSAGPSRPLPAVYHRPDHHSKAPSHASQTPPCDQADHTRITVGTTAPRLEGDQCYDPRPSSVDLSGAERAKRRHQAHLDAEKKRRESINAGVEAIRDVVPGTSENDSKAILLDKAVQYILHLESLLRDPRRDGAVGMRGSESGENHRVKIEPE